MAANRAEEDKPDALAESRGGGMKAWMPLLLTALIMPVLAYAMTQFVLLPRLQKGLGTMAVSASETRHGYGQGAEGGHARHGDKPQHKVQLSKIVVNVSGSQGARLLLASLTLAGSHTDFKDLVEGNEDELRDLAASTLSGKTISDLERPDARNVLRSELISQFNAALGEGVVQEIYITELAIQ